MSSNETMENSDEDVSLTGLTPTPPSSSIQSDEPGKTPPPPSSSQPSDKKSSSRSRSFGSQPFGSQPGREKPTHSMHSDMVMKDATKESSNLNQNICQVKIEFLNSEGIRVEQSRSSFDPQLISIFQSMIRSGNHEGHKKSSVSKLLDSSLFQEEIQNQVIFQLSANFSNFLSSPDCSLKYQDIFNNDLEELMRMDLNELFTSVISSCPEFVNLLSVLCFDKSLKEVLEGENNKFEKQRLFTIINIAAFTRNQKINVFQKLLGNFCKKKNTSKQCLQLLQRLGVSLVPTALRKDEDKLGVTFLAEVTQRKFEIEEWARVREILETMSRKESKLKILRDFENLKVKFFEDEVCDSIADLSTLVADTDREETIERKNAMKLVSEFGSSTLALEKHISARPKLLDVTYDNIDVGVQCNDFLAGSTVDKSLHWTSSMVVEDIVDGIEIDDTQKQKDILKIPFEERVSLTNLEKEHLLNDYTEYIKHLIDDNWPEVFPGMDTMKKIPHQYSDAFASGVKSWTGPLVFETESTLEGISKVITEIVDKVCPVKIKGDGSAGPVYTTVFSGDNKTEKAARSAQLAMVDNGTMRTRLDFIAGRHELLHLYFVLCDIAVDCFCDSENLEEGSSLSRLISWLNPKLEGKKGKDYYYAFRHVFEDIFAAIVGEFFRTFMGAENLREDLTPEHIKEIEDPVSKQIAFTNLVRKFVILTHDEFSSCDEKKSVDKKLPKFYPHHSYLRTDKLNKKKADEENNNTSKDTEDKKNAKPIKGKPVKNKKDKEKPDLKLNYGLCLMSYLGKFLFLINCQKEGNGLDSFLLQKSLHKVIYSTGHKNYSTTISSFKLNILADSDPQFSHRYMWNTSAGRAGALMPRDQRQEHLNRYLKDSFKSLGVNLNPKTATRINNSADIGLKLDEKCLDFFDLDISGKKHTEKDHKPQIEKIRKHFEEDKLAIKTPGRKFKGPKFTSSNFSNSFDEAQFRAWSLDKDKELYRKSFRFRNEI